MRIRIEKEMPFAMVGEEFNIKHGIYFNFNACGDKKPDGTYRGTNWLAIEDLISSGWISIVDEPKTLEEKFRQYEYTSRGITNMEKLADIAREHFLEIINRSVNKSHSFPSAMAEIIEAIKKDGPKWIYDNPPMKK